MTGKNRKDFERVVQFILEKGNNGQKITLKNIKQDLNLNPKYARDIVDSLHEEDVILYRKGGLEIDTEQAFDKGYLNRSEHF